MLNRYERQMMLPEIGSAGQARLAAARILIVGCGALGSMQAQALARAGVGYLRIVDRDCVDLTNLHRQFLYTEADVASGRHKAHIAARRLSKINSEVAIDSHVMEVTTQNIEPLTEDIDLVLDGTDNAATRHIINAICIRRRIRWIYGGVLRSCGLFMAVDPGKTACLRCIFPDMPVPRTTQEVPQGVFPTAPAVIGGLQATLALRILLDAPSVFGRLFQFDFWRMQLIYIDVARRADCPVCGA